MSTSPVPASAPAAPAISTPSRMLAVFHAPTKAFASLRGTAKWYSFVAPWLLVSVFSFIFVFTVGQKIGWQQVFDNNMRMAGPSATARFEQLPPAQRAQAVRTAVTVTKFFSYGFSIITLVVLIIVAAVLLGTFNFGAGAQLDFKTSLAVVMYASLPDILKLILAIATLFAGVSPDGFMIQNPVATNPGYFIDFTQHPALASLLMRLDVFSIWSLALMGIGFAAVSKMKRSTTMSVVFGWYVFVALISAGWALLQR